MGTGVSRRVSASKGKRRLVSAGVWSWFGVRLVTFGHFGFYSVIFGHIWVILRNHGNRRVSACFGEQGQEASGIGWCLVMVWSPPGHIRSLWVLFGHIWSHLGHFEKPWEQACLGVFRRARARGVWYRLVSGHGLESAWSHSVTLDLIRSYLVTFG